MEISQLPKKVMSCLGQTQNSFILGISLFIDILPYLNSSLKKEFILKLEEIANRVGMFFIKFSRIFYAIFLYFSFRQSIRITRICFFNAQLLRIWMDFSI